MALVKIANASELKDGQAKKVTANGVEIALYKVNGKFYASQNNCPHKGGPLGEGTLENSTVICPWHGWQYDVTSGQNLVSPAIKLKIYKTEVKDEEVYLEL